MFFKRGAAPGLIKSGFFTLVAAGLVLSGCGLSLTGRPPANQQVQIGGATSACLTGAGQTVSDYFHGTAQPQQVSNFWDCSLRALQSFEARTTGAVPGVYTPEELKNFLEHYFFTGQAISPALVTQAMALKAGLLGGDAGHLTHADLEQIKVAIVTLKQQSLALQSVFPLGSSPLSAEDPARFDAAMVSLGAAASRLEAGLRAHAGAYSFSSLQRLLTELENFRGTAHSESELATIQAWVPLLQTVKKVLVSPDAEVISPSDWPVLSRQLTDAFRYFLQVMHVFNANQGWYYGAGREKLHDLFGQVRALLDQAIDRNPGAVIRFADLDELVDRLRDSTFAYAGPYTSPAQARAHIQALLRPLAGRIFGEAGSAAQGLTHQNLAELAALIDDVNQGQILLEKRFAGAGNLLTATLPAELLIHADLGGLGGDAAFTEANQRMVAILNSAINTDDRSLMEPGQNQMTLLPGKPPFSFDGLSRMNGIDALAGLILSRYAADPSRGLEQDDQRKELTDFYLDLRGVGIDIKLFDPHGVNVPDRHFLEANLFTFTADGDNFLSRPEASELLLFMMSIKTLSSRITHLMARSCPAAPGAVPRPVDIFGTPEIPSDCYRHAFFDLHPAEIWDHLPGLARYYAGLPARGGAPRNADPTVYRETFACILESVSRSGDHRVAHEGDVPSPDSPETPPDPNWFNSGDSDQFSGLSHYLEAVFVRFDRNQDGFLDRTEVLDAYPVFKATLVDYIAKHKLDPFGLIRSDRDYQAVLNYLLANGKTPGAFDYVKWRVVQLFDGDFRADRGRLLQVMGIVTGKDTRGCFK